MYFLTRSIEIDRRVSDFECYLNSVYRGFTRISDEQLGAIRDDYGSIHDFIKEFLEYEGDGLPDELLLAPDRRKEVPESSLQVDAITYGIVDEKMIPESEGRKRIVQHRERYNIQVHEVPAMIQIFAFPAGDSTAQRNLDIHDPA